MSQVADDLTLQRGGETLALKKTETRFTARAQQPEVIPSVAQGVPAQCLHQIPVGSQTEAVLLEFEVSQPADLTAAMDQTRDRPDVAFVSHVYALVDNPGTLVYLADDLTVQFADSVSDEARQVLARDLGLGDETVLVGLDHAFIYRVTREATENPIKIANRLMERQDVLAAEPNIVVHSALAYRPSDRYYPQQWYLHHRGGQGLAEDSHIWAEAAWDITRGDRSVVVAIADDAIDLNHPDFQGIGKIVAPRDFRSPNDFLPLPRRETDNHGTACAGVCLAEENGEGIVGIAPRCALMPLATSGYLDDRSIDELFDWAIDRGGLGHFLQLGGECGVFPLVHAATGSPEPRRPGGTRWKRLCGGFLRRGMPIVRPVVRLMNRAGPRIFSQEPPNGSVALRPILRSSPCPPVRA